MLLKSDKYIIHSRAWGIRIVKVGDLRNFLTKTVIVCCDGFAYRVDSSGNLTDFNQGKSSENDYCTAVKKITTQGK